MTDDEGLRGRLTRQSEEALGRLAQDLLESPLVSGALQRAFDAREKAVQAQEVAMGALNLPSAADLERLTRRLRSVSQRLEGIEDGLDRVEERVHALGAAPALDDRLAEIESKLERLAAQVGRTPRQPRGAAAQARRLEEIGTQVEAMAGELQALRRALPEPVAPLPRGQERIPVEGA
jgi:tetrahydromethanopterin S-methyltransferase subunit G